MFYLNEGKRVVKFWVGDEVLKDDIKKQMVELSNMPFIFKNGIACMPDVHYSNGSAAVGSVIPTVNAVIPSTIGIDIGCGMSAVQTSLHANDLPDSLLSLRLKMEEAIPTGQKIHTQEDKIKEAWDYAPELRSALHNFSSRIPKMMGNISRIEASLGSQGAGNHFAELCLDEKQNVWLMNHSGSRALGGVIGNQFISEAREQMTRYFIDLPNESLSYLVKGTSEFDDYIKGVNLAQQFAKLNRHVMMQRALAALHSEVSVPFTFQEKAIDCHHNYVSFETHFNQKMIVARKGAINADAGKLGIIPGSMGAKSFIVRGKGEAQSYRSCSHGAGRIMSRTEARKHFSVEDLKKQTQGVESRKDEAIVDEIPGAYKDIDVVMNNQKDLVEIVHTLKAVLCVKGA